MGGSYNKHKVFFSIFFVIFLPAVISDALHPTYLGLEEPNDHQHVRIRAEVPHSRVIDPMRLDQGLDAVHQWSHARVDHSVRADEPAPMDARKPVAVDVAVDLGDGIYECDDRDARLHER